MKIKINNIQEKSDTIIIFKLQVEYGYDAEILADIITLTLNTEKLTLHISLKVHKPGIFLVADKIIRIFNKYDKQSLSKQKVLDILDDSFEAHLED